MPHNLPGIDVALAIIMVRRTIDKTSEFINRSSLIDRSLQLEDTRIRSSKIYEPIIGFVRISEDDNGVKAHQSFISSMHPPSFIDQ